jgi:hypothetical protein
MTVTPRRRWFAYSLRTLFAAVTLFTLSSGWILHSLRWIQEREEGPRQPYTITFTDQRLAPGVIWLFGAVGYGRIFLNFPGDPQENQLTKEQRAIVAQVKRTYPEATVTVVPPFMELP